MKKIINKGFIIVGILISIYILILCTITNFNIGNLMTLGIGILFILFGTIWDRLPKNKIVKLFKFTVYLGITFLFSMIVFIYLSSNTKLSQFNEDAVIVLGSAIHGEEISLPLKSRLDKCIEYIKKNKDAIIIVTGGQGPQEKITEALAMERYLVKNGVDKNKIIKEEKATSTNENFKYSKEILDKYFNSPYKITYITNDFHSYRASKLAELAGLDATSYNTKTAYSSIAPAYTREVLAIIQLWIFKK